MIPENRETAPDKNDIMSEGIDIELQGSRALPGTRDTVPEGRDSAPDRGVMIPESIEIEQGGSGMFPESGEIAPESRRRLPEVKICGLRRPEDVEYVNEAGADYAGFVFFEKSSRNITFAQAERLLARLDRRIRPVAVCVSPDAEMLRELRGLGFPIIQIHGAFPREFPWHGQRAGRPSLWRAVNLSFDTQREGSGYSAQSRAQLERSGYSAQDFAQRDDGRPEETLLRMLSSDLLSQMAADGPQVTGYVVDGARYGGGRTFGWEQNEPAWRALAGNLRRMAGGRRLILAGGLTAENAAQGIRIFEPDVVDVSSGVETGGYKDREKIIQFIREAKRR